MTFRLLLVAFPLLATLQLTAQDTLSFGGVYDLPGAEVRASYRPVSPLAQSFTIEEVYRLPGTFYDPARLVNLLPGVVQTNDQANHLSVRGNTPNANLWRLNGLAIVNPNHTANAGTFYDFPTLSGGGVNSISAQMLDNSAFLAGGLPAAYGHATGGTFDLRLRPGQKGHRRHQVQAGFIGFDLATEGPIGRDSALSYLVNARYSFTGLLADLGADFGGEEIRFADANTFLDYRFKGGRIGLFSILGRSTNDFTRPGLPLSELSEQKEIFNISFLSDVLIIGGDFAFGGFSGGYAFSETFAYRTARVGLPVPEPVDQLQQIAHRMNSANLKYEGVLHPIWNYQLGVEYLGVRGGAFEFYGSIPLDLIGSPPHRINYHAVSPFASLRYADDRTTATLGLRQTRYFGGVDRSVFEPRLELTYGPGRGRVTLLAERVSRVAAAPFLLASRTNPTPNGGRVVRSDQLSLSYGRSIGPINTRLTAFWQYSPEEPAALAPGGNFLYGSGNLLEVDPNLTFDQTAASRRYGLELEAAGGTLDQGWYYRGNLTLLNAQTRQTDGSWAQNRYAVDFIGKLTLGREWAGRDRRERLRTYGLNVALITHGGERFNAPLTSPDGSEPSPTTLGARGSFAYEHAFSQDLSTYFRPDLRLYKTKEHRRIMTTLALDIQNVANYENVGTFYYDTLTEQVEARNQLGIIPVLSYRIAWR